MKILIIGGTRFLGRYLVESVINRSHDVTLFNRGKSNPDLFPDINQILGDRDGELDKLGSQNWDAVIDTCGYYPRIVSSSAEYLTDKVKHYTFISSISVYADLSKPGVNEKSPVGTIEDETIEEITENSYGPLKALCEQAVEKSFPDSTLVVRPGLIVGPNDMSDRFTYWIHRIAKGGKVLVPEPKDYNVQYIDVRDLADWIIEMVENGDTGTFNGIGPNKKLTMSDFLNICRAELNVETEFVWVNQKFLEENKVEGWSELPIWVPEKKYLGLMQTNCEKAFKNGLKFRPLEITIKDTLRYCKTRPNDYKWLAGIDSKREIELLGKWNSNK
ncbi:MAG: SDR family oxidoreductase [candidate division Zixibacteria bacterium]|nr:SDR family oxidoreductase [candidate division Zixibacteria bacterium]